MRWRFLVVGAVVGASCAVLGAGLADDGAEPPEAVGPAWVAEAATPHPSPRYLVRRYRAPAELVDRGAGGVLAIPRLHVRVPVDAVGLDGTAMAVPDDPARVGWLTTTTARTGREGSSVISGHVSDENDRPGSFSRLAELDVGDEIVWSNGTGAPRRFEVRRLQQFPRVTGLPAAVFGHGGERLLRLVTCADRRTLPGGGFHYAANLVVTATATDGG